MKTTQAIIVGIDTHKASHVAVAMYAGQNRQLRCREGRTIGSLWTSNRTSKDAKGSSETIPHLKTTRDTAVKSSS